MSHIEAYKAATSVGAEGVKAANIEAEAVVATKLVKPAAAPAKKEKLAEAGTTTPARKRTFSVTGKKAAEPTKFGLKHEFATKLIASVTVQKAAAEDGGDPLLNAAGAGNYTWKIVSAEEIEVIWGTEPGAGEEFFVTVTA